MTDRRLSPTDRGLHELEATPPGRELAPLEERPGDAFDGLDPEAQTLLEVHQDKLRRLGALD